MLTTRKFCSPYTRKFGLGFVSYHGSLKRGAGWVCSHPVMGEVCSWVCCSLSQSLKLTKYLILVDVRLISNAVFYICPSSPFIWLEEVVEIKKLFLQFWPNFIIFKN